MSEYYYSRDIYADNCCFLSVQSTIFALLSTRVLEKEVKFTREDINGILVRIVNSGFPPCNVGFSYDYREFKNFISQYREYFREYGISGEERYVVNMEALISSVEAEFTEQERNFFANDEYRLKQFALFCRLGMDIALIYGDYGDICHGLRLTFIR